MPSYQLATINIAKMKYDYDAPEMADFVSSLDPIYDLAEASPGFIWRPDYISGTESTKHVFGGDILVNMSVWESLTSLHHFIYQTPHLEIMGRRRQWFGHMTTASTVLWWVREGTQPSLEEAKEKLETLDRLSPTPEAFTFKNAFPPPQIERTLGSIRFDQPCPAGEA